MGLLYKTAHFAILDAFVGHRKYKWALLELKEERCPTKIDSRQRAVKRIIRWTYLYKANWNFQQNWRTRNFKAVKRNQRIWSEWKELIEKAERVYPNTFLVRGFPPPNIIDNPMWFWEVN